MKILGEIKKNGSTIMPCHGRIGLNQVRKGEPLIKKKLWPLDARTISNLLVVIIGISFYLVVSHYDGLSHRISQILEVLAPFIAGFAIAYLLNTPMSFFECKVYHKLRWKRGLSILTVYALALLVVIILLNLILPQVIDSIVALVSNINYYLANLNDFVNSIIVHFELDGEGIDNIIGSYTDIINEAANFVKQVLPNLLNFGVALGSGVISGITALISSIYMLSGKGRLEVQLKKMLYAFFPKKKVDRLLDVCRKANDIFAGFINGKLIDSAIIGVLCFIFCTILRIPFAVLISVVVGVTNIIPFFGPLIGAIPSIMILIIVNPWAALKFGILIIALQQFDGNVLGPKILGNSTGLSAIWVLVAIVVGGGLFGPLGMILGVPTFAVIYMLIRDSVYFHLAEKGIDGDGNCVAPPKKPSEETKS